MEWIDKWFLESKQEEKNFFWEEIVNPERLSVKQETNPDLIKFTTPSGDTVHINVVEKDEPQLKEYYYRDKYWNPIELELAKSWQPFSQVPIEKLPEFDYKNICGKYSGQKFPEAKAIIEYWKHIELITTTVNKLIERFNNK